MTQQLAIIVLVDVGTALTSKTLDGNTYLFDNMQFHGSTGEGTGELVTAINGSYWQDGSQGTEEVLNWLPYSLGSIPPTLPRGYHAICGPWPRSPWPARRPPTRSTASTAGSATG
jgi:hypothetical protein